MNNNSSIEVEWYFDFISPFAYIQARSFSELPSNVVIKPIPVLFAGLLNYFGQKGPAEIEGKREHTYRYCHWLAKRNGISFTMPEAHPFNPLAILRLSLLRNSNIDEVIIFFRGIFEQAYLPSSDEFSQWLSKEIGDSISFNIDWPEQVKNSLRKNTEMAIHNGVFGVPTFRYNQMNFWGVDSMGMLQDALSDPTYFDCVEYTRLKTLPVAKARE